MSLPRRRGLRSVVGVEEQGRVVPGASLVTHMVLSRKALSTRGHRKDYLCRAETQRSQTSAVAHTAFWIWEACATPGTTSPAIQHWGCNRLLDWTTGVRDCAVLRDSEYPGPRNQQAEAWPVSGA